MKDKIFHYIIFNSISLVFFLLVIFKFFHNVTLLLVAFSILWISALATTIFLIKSSNYKSTGVFKSNSNYKFLLLWNIIGLLMLLGCIFFGFNNRFLVSLTTISLMGALGANLGAYIRYRKQKK